VKNTDFGGKNSDYISENTDFGVEKGVLLEKNKEMGIEKVSFFKRKWVQIRAFLSVLQVNSTIIEPLFCILTHKFAIFTQFHQ
jgi:hypothetical protein